MPAHMLSDWVCEVEQRSSTLPIFGAVFLVSLHKTQSEIILEEWLYTVGVFRCCCYDNFESGIALTDSFENWQMH